MYGQPGISGHSLAGLHTLNRLGHGVVADGHRSQELLQQTWVRATSTALDGRKQSCIGTEIHGSTPSTGKARGVCVRVRTCSARSRRTTAGVPSRGMSAGVMAPPAASPLAAAADSALPSLRGVPPAAAAAAMVRGVLMGVAAAAAAAAAPRAISVE